MIHFDTYRSQPKMIHWLLSRSNLGAMALGVIVVGSWFYVHLNWPDQYVYLTICDVGQGDAILIHQGFRQVLIDSSQDDRVLRCLDRNLPPWDHELDLVLITHYDRDHVGGLVSILGIYRVLNLVADDPPQAFTEANPEFLTQLTMALNQGMVWKRPILGQLIDLNLFHQMWTLKILQTLASETQNYPAWSDNDRSIVSLLTVGQTRALLLGDLETPGEMELLRQADLGPVEILKVGHHGAKTSTSEALLEEINPKLALISVGKTNSYGHPAAETLKKLMNHGAMVLSTADIGDISLRLDGQKYWLPTQKH